MELLENLIKKYPRCSIPYGELLKTIEWRSKRSEILERDKYQCQICQKNKSYFYSGCNLILNNYLEVEYLNINVSLKTDLKSLKYILGVEKLPIYKSEISDTDYFGLTENRQIILVNYTDEMFSHECKIDVWPVTDYKNEIFYLLTRAGDESFINKSYICPIIIETPIHLHVHHKHYYINSFPWEYEDEDLITLCNNCHTELHEKESIPIYENKDGRLIDLQLSKCIRCNGVGSFPEFSHVNDGLCFRCGGEKYEELIRKK